MTDLERRVMLALILLLMFFAAARTPIRSEAQPVPTLTTEPTPTIAVQPFPTPTASLTPTIVDILRINVEVIL